MGVPKDVPVSFQPVSAPGMMHKPQCNRLMCRLERVLPLAVDIKDLNVELLLRLGYSPEEFNRREFFRKAAENFWIMLFEGIQDRVSPHASLLPDSLSMPR